MRTCQGFTLPEILVSVAIVSILAAVLIPSVLAPRNRAYDVATQSCLKEVATRQLAQATQDPFQYDKTFKTKTVGACDDVQFTKKKVTPTAFTYEAKHVAGKYTYTVSAGTGVVRVQ